VENQAPLASARAADIERVAMAGGAHLRAAPDRGAPSLRVIPAALEIDSSISRDHGASRDIG
jgi:hypothetical protein